MKKNLVLIITVAVVLVGGLLYVLASKDTGSSKDNSKSSNSQTSTFAAVDACSKLSLDEAKKLLGDSATAGTAPTPADTTDISVSTCTYVNNATAVADIKSITLLVRSALTQTGADSNKSVFGDGMPEGSTKVENIGDDAYFTASLGQLNVLKGNDWYIMNYGGTSVASQTQANAAEVAHQVFDHHGASHAEME